MGFPLFKKPALGVHMAVGLFQFASGAGDDEVSREAMAAASDAFVCGVVADCRTCGRTAVIWLGGGFTSLADACGRCASIENGHACFFCFLYTHGLAPQQMEHSKGHLGRSSPILRT